MPGTGELSKTEKLQKSQSSERKNDIQNEIRHLFERFDNRLTLGNLCIIKHYIEMKVHILLHLRFLEGEECVVSLQNEPADLRLSERPAQIGRHPSGVTGKVSSDGFCPLTWQEAVRHVRDTKPMQHTVLVNVVELMESPEYRTLPAFVWFDSVYGVYSVLPHALYFSQFSGLVLRGAFGDGKVHVGKWSGLGRPDADEVMGRVIEGTSEVAQNIPDHGGQFKRNRWNSDSIIDAVSRLRVVLEDDRVFIAHRELSVEKGGTGVFEVSDVLVGPLGLSGEPI
jgi:hypothetical protein